MSIYSLLPYLHTISADLNLAVSANGGLAITKTYFSDASYTTPVTATVPSGTYYVIGETAAGCEDSIEVTVRVKPQKLHLPSSYKYRLLLRHSLSMIPFRSHIPYQQKPSRLPPDEVLPVMR